MVVQTILPRADEVFECVFEPFPWDGLGFSAHDAATRTEEDGGIIDPIKHLRGVRRFLTPGERQMPDLM